jgi:hypothetical protein
VPVFTNDTSRDKESNGDAQNKDKRHNHSDPTFFSSINKYKCAAELGSEALLCEIISQQRCTDKKDNAIFLIYKEIQMGAVAKSYRRKGFLI